MAYIVKIARDFAMKKHDGQLDDDGLSYFKAHLHHVAKIVDSAGCSVDMIAAAYLHDTLEDTDTTYSELVAIFGTRIANLVLEVTHSGKSDHYGYYFPHLKTRDAIVIKFADRMSNLLRMDSWSKDRQEHYLKKTKFWKDGKDRD